ncbi:MAG: GNAT family protein [archaeon]|jgi:ribosomal-protein-alanine N-acetyltransferase|nr:GNAT family protein [archaeon]
MELTTQRLIIRDLKLEDAKSISKYSSNLNVSRFMSNMPYPNAIPQVTEYIEKSIKDTLETPRINYRFGIAQKEDNQVIGGIALTALDDYNKTATIGYWIGEEFWNKGIMTEVAKKVIEFAFDKLDLRRINANAHTENISSNKLLKKIGFIFEGTRIKLDRVKSTGELRDTNIYGLLKENWVKNHKN